MSNAKVVEMIPKDMPEWANDAMMRGQLFRECLDRIKELEGAATAKMCLNTRCTFGENFCYNHGVCEAFFPRDSHNH